MTYAMQRRVLNRIYGRSSTKCRTLQFLMEVYYLVTEIPTWLLCDRVTEIDGRLLLHEYVPEEDVYVDSGYAVDLKDLATIMYLRYKVKFSGLHLVRSFEEAVKMFDLLLPRVIHLARIDVFCVHRGDVLFSAKWDYDAEGRPFVKRMEWLLDGEEPKTVAEALERLNEYAEKHNKWIVFRQWIKSATAYEVCPRP